MKDWGFSADQLWEFRQSAVGTPCGDSYISASKTCRVGGGFPPLRNDVDDSMDLPKSKPTEHDLDMMQAGFEAAVRNDNDWSFPFEIPANYNNSSGTIEAVTEVTSLRGVLKQDRNTGKIEIPEGVEVSPKARALLKEYNELDLSTLYSNSAVGVALNVNGLGVAGGPRNSVPKDSIRGFVQYVALRRQDATLIDTPNGKLISTYRDPFSGTPRGFYGTKIPTSGKFKGEEVTAIKGSQDHWNKPFGIYGPKSEDDVLNTVFMPAGMNNGKGSMSPTRYAYTSLVRAGRITDQEGMRRDGDAVGGFAQRYAKAGPKYDFLPKGLSRTSENATLAETATQFVAGSNRDIQSKYVPRLQKALTENKVRSYADSANLFYSIAKQEATETYYGQYFRFTTDRMVKPNETQFLKGVNLSGATPKIKSQIEAAMKVSGMSPQEITSLNLANRGVSVSPRTAAPTTPSPRRARATPATPRTKPAPKKEAKTEATPTRNSRSQTKIDLRRAISKARRDGRENDLLKLERRLREI